MVVHQWRQEWDEAQFDELQHRRKPEPNFYLLVLKASALRRLSGIYRRSTEEGTSRAKDLGIQRRHDVKRSAEIGEFVRRGFPWLGLSEARRSSGDYDDLIKPGWLPTAIVVNMLTDADLRDGRRVSKSDAVTIDGSAPVVSLSLPEGFDSDEWEPDELPPLEVIDGQHRLWAFAPDDDDFELPVVAFRGLDLSWQAYLFYTINIKPTRINTSLAFDLYPLLRTEDWLEKFEGHSVYRETRAQELAEAMWSYPESPWHNRINMLGESGGGQVTQASWIRSLMATFVKSFEGRGVQIGGLFGALIGQHRLALGWSRAQQSAFLILLWQQLEEAVAECEAGWAEDLREENDLLLADAAFSGSATLLNTDIGVRGVLFAGNDLCFLRVQSLQLFEWQTEVAGGDGLEQSAISQALQELRELPVAAFLSELAATLGQFDWRTSKAHGLTERERQLKTRFRGGSGYRELRGELYTYLAAAGGDVGNAAEEAREKLRKP